MTPPLDDVSHLLLSLLFFTSYTFVDGVIWLVLCIMGQISSFVDQAIQVIYCVGTLQQVYIAAGILH
jgi:hypothetical protein